jgi:hypothetical protein
LLTEGRGRQLGTPLAPSPDVFAFFLALREPDRVAPRDVKGSQRLEPLGESSGASAVPRPTS